MLDQERIAKIDSMTEAQMRVEIAHDRHSAFGEESRAYMAKRLAVIEAEQARLAEVEVTQRIAQATESNNIGREANSIARESGVTGRQNLRWLKWTAVIALVGAIVAVGVVRCS